MPLVSASLDAFLFTSLAIAIPWLYFSFRPTNHPPNTTTTHLRSLLNVFLLLHTLSILYALIVLPPPNLFTRLNVPLSTPTDTLRKLLHHARIDNPSPNAAIPKPLETLLKRLGSFEMRTLYVRFGHTVVATCEYCHTFGDYALYAFPRPFLSYIREAAVIGLITIKGTNRERLRSLGIGALAAAALIEAYWISTARIEIPRPNERSVNVIMYHDRLLTLRRTLHLLLPLLIHHLPPSPPPPSTASNPHTTLTTLETALTRLHLLKYTRGAVLRHPALSARARAWWGAEAREGRWVLGDGAVRGVARGVGLAFDEGDVGVGADGDVGQGAGGEGGEGMGRLRARSRGAVGGLADVGFGVSEYWKAG